MKCLSLWNPWAALLVHGRKRVETRGWPIRHRGPLLIHAAKTWNGDLSSMCVREPFKNALECMGIFHDNPFTKPHGLHFGAIVGRVDVVACYPTGMVGGHLASAAADAPPEHLLDQARLIPLRIGRTERAFGDYSPGRFAFLCANFVTFAEPIPYRGLQGLFDVPDAVVEKARAA